MSSDFKQHVRGDVRDLKIQFVPGNVLSANKLWLAYTVSFSQPAPKRSKAWSHKPRWSKEVPGKHT